MVRHSRRILGWKEFALAAAVATFATAAFVAVLGFQPGGERLAVGVDDIGEAVAALIAAAACAWTASRSVGRFRRGWALLAASAAAWCIGELVWSVYEVGLNVASPFPSAADAGFLVAVPLAIALTFTGWSLGFQQVFLSPGTTFERAILLAYPVGDILIATILILAIRRATRIQHGRLLLLLGGLAANAIADSAFAYMTATGTYPTLLIDAGWVVGYLMIALAALWPARPSDRVADEQPVDLWQIALPWAAVLTAGASALLVVLRGQATDQFQWVLAVAMVTLLAISEVVIPGWTTWRAGPRSDPHLDGSA